MYQMQNCSNQAFNPAYNPALQPQVNAVKIDIHHPEAYGGMNSDGVANQPMPNSMYSYPYAPMYTMPVNDPYATPNAYPQPYFPQQPIMNTMQQPQQPSQPAAIAQQPVVQQPTPVIPVPVVPMANPAQPAVSAPVTQQVNIGPQSVPQAVVDNTDNTKVNPVTPVQPQPAQADVDVNALLTGLSSANVDDQTTTIQKIAELAQANNDKSKALLNEQVFGQLVNLINSDTSKLEGPKGDGKLSALEKAETNKQYAIYTLAMLQKNFREEINKEMKKNNLPDISINDLPYIKEGIVNNLKDNQNPVIRVACLSALDYIAKPEDKEVLKTLYSISAQHDPNDDVKKLANSFLSKLPA